MLKAINNTIIMMVTTSAKEATVRVIPKTRREVEEENETVPTVVIQTNSGLTMVAGKLILRTNYMLVW